MLNLWIIFLLKICDEKSVICNRHHHRRHHHHHHRHRHHYHLHHYHHHYHHHQAGKWLVANIRRLGWFYRRYAGHWKTDLRLHGRSGFFYGSVASDWSAPGEVLQPDSQQSHCSSDSFLVFVSRRCHGKKLFSRDILFCSENGGDVHAPILDCIHVVVCKHST